MNPGDWSSVASWRGQHLLVVLTHHGHITEVCRPPQRSLAIEASVVGHHLLVSSHTRVTSQKSIRLRRDHCDHW